MMATPPFIVYESASKWTVAMRWALPASQIPVRQLASLEQCVEALEQAPQSVIAIEVAQLGVEGAVRTIRDLRTSFADCKVIALADSATAIHEPLLREAGAVHVTRSRRDLRATARLVERCLADCQPAPTSYREEVWNRMPWSDHALTE